MSSKRTFTASVSFCAQYSRHCRSNQRGFSQSVDRLNEHESRLPRVISPSLWSSLIPKAWRRSGDSAEVAAKRANTRAFGAEDRRTGIVFLILGLVVGSNAIHLLNIKREMLNYTRQTEAKLAALREVIQRVQNGEDVDVKRLLGTGDAKQEAEWEEVIKELENTDTLWEARKKRDAEREEKAFKRNASNRQEQRPTTDNTDNEKGDRASLSAQSSGPRFLM